MLCPKCGQENPAGARFCNACGAALGREAPPAGEALHLDLLHRYISKPLADKMRALGGRIEGERRHVTVMFADLSGFTAMSEKLDPEDVTSVMNACFKELVEVVFKYEGTIDKFIGDEIMALFGVPIAHENDPERSVRAALEMQERLRAFNETVKVPLPKPLTMHVGINSGEVIAGNIGTDPRDYTVVGDTVNLAARLADAADSGQTFVSDRTYALTRRAFEFKKLRPFKVQGKKRKVQVYEVLGSRKVPESGRGVQAGYGPLIDREGEMAVLRGAVEAVRQGQGRVLGLVGEAGIGKTRLVHELRQMAEDFTIASGACTSYEAPPAYQVFTDVMRGLLRIEADDPEGVIRQRIETWVAAHDLDAEGVPYLGSLFALRDERLLYLQDEERYQGMQGAALSVLRAATANGPLLMVLEDLHWIDASSRRLLDDLVGQAGSLPLLLCCVYRPEFQHEWEGIPGCRTLTVEPLSREHTVALSESIVKLDMSPELEQAILSRAEGNPFFIEEMLKALMDEGVIARTRTGYALQKDISAIQLPATMQGVIMARIDRLEAQARETLQVASVIGRRFSDALLKAVSPRAQRVEQDLEQLQGLDLVYQHSLLPDLEYIFKHFVTREVAYNSILVKRRKAIHLETARAMERIYRERLEEYYEALAHHFEAGEDWQKAADYFGKAGTKARELHSDAGAMTFLERRDQAVQKVFEQKEGTSQYRYILIAGPLVSFFCYELFKMSLGLFPRNWIGWVAKPLLLLLWMGGVLKFIRARVADSLTIYSDRLLIRGRKDITQIYFQTIASVQLFRQRRYRMNRKEQIVFGASGYWTAFRERYFGVGNVIRMTRRTEKPVILHSLNSGEVYRELKLSMTQWAVAQKIDIAGTLTGSHSMCEEQYHLPLRQVDGIHLPAVTYDQLVDKIVKGEVEKKDEVFVREKRARDPVWVSLETAAQEDSRLWAALHPVCHSLIACCYHPLFSIAILLLVLAAFLTIGRRPGGDITHFGNILLLGSGSILFMLMGMHLRFGFLEWTKRYALSRWQQIGLRVVTGGAVAAIVYGLIRLNLLAW